MHSFSKIRVEVCACGVARERRTNQTFNEPTLPKSQSIALLLNVAEIQLLAGQMFDGQLVFGLQMRLCSRDIGASELDALALNASGRALCVQGSSTGLKGLLLCALPRVQCALPRVQCFVSLQ